MTDIEQSTYDDFVAGIKKLTKRSRVRSGIRINAAVLFMDGELVASERKISIFPANMVKLMCVAAKYSAQLYIYTHTEESSVQR